MTGDRVVMAVMQSVDPQAWQQLSAPIVAGQPIPVTAAQWQSVVLDSGLHVQVQRVLAAIDHVRGAAGSSTIAPASGRELRRAVLMLTADVGRLREIVRDVLWFEPPDSERPQEIRRYVHQVCVEVIDLLDALAAGEPVPPAFSPNAAGSTQPGVVPPAADENDDRVARVYGVPIDQVPRPRSHAASGLRRVFRGRQHELDAATTRVIGYALNGRTAAERLDGTMHVWALATDDHPFVAHAAARAACDLVHMSAAADLGAAATAIVDGLRNEQDLYSSHRAHSQARRQLLAADDPDDRTRAVTDIYRITTEGQLRHAATAVLRLLGDQVSPTAGLNELRSRLLGFRGRTPLCLMIAELIVPAWRNPSAHEDLHWDPDVGAAVLGERAVDLREVLHAADLAWSVARGFQAGVQIGRACLPELARAIGAIERPYSPIGRSFMLVKHLDQPSLALDVYDIKREPDQVTIVLDPIGGDNKLSRVGTALVGMANLEPAVARWAFEFAEDVPRFEVSGAAIDGAASLYASVGGQDRVRAFIYPPAFAPLLAEAMVSLGTTPNEAAAVAWDLPLRDTLEATADLASTDSVYRREWVAHEYAAIRRTNAAVRTVARLLGVRAPANLDLSALLSLLRRIEKRPRDAGLRGAFAAEHRRLHSVLGPPRSHPWSAFGQVLNQRQSVSWHRYRP